MDWGPRHLQFICPFSYIFTIFSQDLLNSICVNIEALGEINHFYRCRSEFISVFFCRSEFISIFFCRSEFISIFFLFLAHSRIVSKSLSVFV